MTILNLQIEYNSQDLIRGNISNSHNSGPSMTHEV